MKQIQIPLFELKITSAKYRDILDFISNSKGFIFDLYPEHSKFNIYRKIRRTQEREINLKRDK